MLSVFSEFCKALYYSLIYIAMMKYRNIVLVKTENVHLKSQKV